jgi:7-keto-8-aminopelargonate synthetase-like enzyme
MMQVSIKARDGKKVVMPDGREVIEFINCSYLGLDVHPEVVEAYTSVPKEWGVNFCCARSRFSIEPLRVLEEELSSWYRGRAITFPSVTTTHLSVMPLLSSGVLIDEKCPPKVRWIFDRFAHSSMQYLKPILMQEASVDTIPHNSLEDLRVHVQYAKSRGETPIYVADGIYSMGGVCPVPELLRMAEELDFYLYLDDAHGTAIVGERGEGAVLAQVPGDLPDRIFLAFSLTKGFGTAGGGILVSNRRREMLIRSFGQIYAFSAPLDFASIHASLAVLKLHRQGEIENLQAQLRQRVDLFDSCMGKVQDFSPIRMIPVGDEQEAIRFGRYLLEQGFFVSVAFFPIVPRGQAQLRICLASNHQPEEIVALTGTLQHWQKTARFERDRDLSYDDYAISNLAFVGA